MRNHFIASVCLLLLFAFVRPGKSRSAIVARRDKDTVSILTVDPGTVFQTIHSFGASDCWTAKFAGAWKDETKKNAIADLLFSTGFSVDGSPRGIGLSLWRFNIGAGSYEQGAASGIADEYRREECFLAPDGKYNWNKQAGAQWFLKAAKKRGVPYLLGFTNSAPVQFTRNGKGYGLANNDLSCNANQYGDFADFLVAVVKHFKAAGTPLDFVSPVNEPQWKWGEHADQEGSGATNEQIAKLVRMLGLKLHEAGLSATITAAEAAQVNYLYGSNSAHTGNQLQEFFDAASGNYLGNAFNTEKLLAYHSYFSTCPDTTLFNSRRLLNKQRQAIDPAVQLWQSEFGVLGNICGELNGGPRNTGMEYGLYVAKVIHADLAIAGVSSFQWWLAINPYNYSDGLVYINAPDGSINPAKSREDGTVSDSKQLWCMGNFSRFIRPGMQRVNTVFTGAPDCLVSAYKDDRTRQLVVVAVNGADASTALRINIPGAAVKDLDIYTTSATENMHKSIARTDRVILPSFSVTTLVTTY